MTTTTSTAPIRCTDCDAVLTPGTGITHYTRRMAEHEDDGIYMALGEIARCNDATQCAARVIANATNLDALERIACDAENLGSLAIQARAILDTRTQDTRQRQHVLALQHLWD